MEKFLKIFIITLVAIVFSQCQKRKDTYIKFTTNMGDFTVKLYNDTPLHKKNFIKLCKNRTYDSLLFHRVIENFVVQGGDLDSKDRIPGALYGENGGNYTVPAEILENHPHKRGALIDAREWDEVNPLRVSSATQFCIVQGLKYNDTMLNNVETLLNKNNERYPYYSVWKLLKKKYPRFDSLTLARRIDKALNDSTFKLPKIKISEEKRKIYKTIGGIPSLDGFMTVFGEITEGQEIIEKISLVKTDSNDRPLKDVIILSSEVFLK